ncbi:MAG: hypothetical protein CMO32_03010 [Variovorax sp.]|jgi:hypothetical protein|nr:hypothetical protein [Variovorax sp.]MBS74727.1 hypothetical protein [Variovorax sp.]
MPGEGWRLFCRPGTACELASARERFSDGALSSKAFVLILSHAFRGAAILARSRTLAFGDLFIVH